MLRVRRRTLGVLAVLTLATALVPATAASAAHGDDLDLSVDTREPDTTGAVEDLVSDQVELVVTAENTSDATLADAAIALDLPDGFTYESVAGQTADGSEATCTVRDDAPELLCDVGDLDDAVDLTVTADTTSRAASAVTTVAYATWRDVPAVHASDTAVLADATIQLEDVTAEASTDPSVAIVNTAETTAAENVVAAVQLPDPTDSDVEATIVNAGPNASCDRPDAADGHVICQNIAVAPGGPLEGLPTGAEPTITVTGLDEGEHDILVEAKGDNTSRAALGYDADGAVDESTKEFHEAAERTPSDAVQPLRSVTAGLGVLLNREAIDLPATEFTPVFGQVDFTLDDDTDTGAVRTEWVEGDTRYEYETSTFRSLDPSLDYFQDGGVNFDTHQHGGTMRPDGPGNIPDLWTQALVYSVGTLTRHNADGTTEAFDNVAMHLMFRQLAKPESDVEPFQRWADKGPKPDRTETIDYDFSEDGPTSPLPYDLNLVDVLFANTPTSEGECQQNGVAGTDCNTDLGTFVRFMSFTDVRRASGFNPSGIDLTTNNPAGTFSTRFDSVSIPTLATTGETVQTPIAVGLNASAEQFATAGQADGRAPATHVVLSRDDVFADALAASGLAGELGPILFTEGGPDADLDPRVLAEIDRILPEGATVYIVGGTNAVSADVETTVEDAGFTVQRLGGANRLETAELIAAEVRQLNPDVDEQILARAFSDDPENNPSRAWADSISAGAYAADQQVPVILTTTDSLHPAAERALDDTATTYVVGGEAAVSADAAAAAPNIERIAGENRQRTAVEVSRQLFDRSEAAAGDTFVLSPGFDDNGWAYGLAAAPFSAQEDAPLLLLEPGAIPSSVSDYLGELGYSSDAVGNVAVSSSLPTDYLVASVLDLLS